MSVREVYEDGRLIERADDSTRLVSTWDKVGNQLPDRPYTAVEDADANLRLATTTRETNAAQLYAGMPQGIVEVLGALNAINKSLAKPNEQINSEFASNPAATLRPLAIGLRYGLKQLARQNRLYIGKEALDSADVGA